MARCSALHDEDRGRQSQALLASPSRPPYLARTHAHTTSCTAWENWLSTVSRNELRQILEMSVALDALIFTTGWTHVFLAPYTKVEESFNLHATHDVLMYNIGIENLYNVRLRVSTVDD
jgi:hypothetical protein